MTTLKHTTKKALSEATDHLEVLKNEAKNIGNDIKNKAVDITQAARDHVVDANDNVVELIKKNPYKSIIAAFLGGFLISKLL